MRFKLVEDILIETKQDIENFINKFSQETYDLFNKSRDRLKNNGYSTDLIYYTKNVSKEELDDILSKLQRKLKINKDESNVSKEGIRGKYNYLGEKDGYKVYQPLDYLASMDLGYMSGWCTTGRYGHAGKKDCKPSEEDAKKHFEDYTSEGIELYYFLDSKTMEGKYAIAKYPGILQVDKFINESIYILETNFRLYNQADKLDYSALDEIPFNMVEGLIINKLESENGLVINSDDTLIKVYPTVTKVTIPARVISIGSFAFANCSSLTSITFGENSQLTSIGKFAFEDCRSLASIEIPSSLTSIGSSAFSDCISLKNVYYNGTLEQWKSIKIGFYNNDLINAKIYYNNLKEQFNKESKVKLLKESNIKELIGFVILHNNQTIDDNSGNPLTFNDYYDAVDYLLSNEINGDIQRYYKDGSYGPTKIEDEDPISPDGFEYDDDISDFGPGNPWGAPGMSVRDFLRG